MSRSVWRRSREGQILSGVSGALARGLGLSVPVVRASLLALGLLGGLLALSFAIFDHALLGRFASDALRRSTVALGLLLLFLYPLLALLLPAEEKPRRWDFASALGGVMILVGIGQALGLLFEPYWRAAKSAFQAGDPLWFVTWIGSFVQSEGVGMKEAVLLLFFASAGAFLWLERKAVGAFFRAMHVGVTLVGLTLLSVASGVLVPQIDGFEDPEQRVDLAREYQDYLLFRERGYQKLPAELEDGFEQYQAFRWAEGYFLYHLLHLYGIGMPEAALAPRMEQGLERFGKKYGIEERDNRRKQMAAMFSGEEKVREIGAFIQRNEESMWRCFQVSTLLDLNRAYKSHWFAALLWLLGFSVCLNAYKNWKLERSRVVHGVWMATAWVLFTAALKGFGAIEMPWGEYLPGVIAPFAATFLLFGLGVPANAFSLQKLGFFVVHNGILVLLLGGFVSKLFTDRGILNLFLGEEPQATYLRHYDTSKQARMPFALKLDHFARKEWKALEVYFPEEEFTSRPPRYTLWEGRKIDLDFVEDEQGSRPRLSIRVERLHDRAEIGVPDVAEAPEGSQVEPFPIVELRLSEATTSSGERRYLSPLEGNAFRDQVVRDPEGAYRLAAAYGGAPVDRFPEDGGPLGLLEVSVVGEEDAAPRIHPVSLGDQLEIPGGYRVSIVDATADFQVGRDARTGSVHPKPLEEQPRGRAALWVDVGPPGDEPPERRVVVEGLDPVQTGMQEAFFHSRVVLRFLWDDWAAPGPPRYLLWWRADGSPVLLAERGDLYPVEIDRPLPLPAGAEIVAKGFFHRPVFEKNIRLLEPKRSPGGWDQDFYSREPRGALVSVTQDPGTAAERTQRVVLATEDYAGSNWWFSEDGRVELLFLENTEVLPFEWRSVLSVLEPGADGRLSEVDLGPEEEREIRVNDYLYYGGYRFFQSNADPREPRYSGIGVVYDPGIPVVLLGMYTIIAGTAVAFLVRPYVQARKMGR